MSGADWPWYEIIRDGSLDQGDLVPHCNVLVAVEAPSPEQPPKAKLRPITALVLTQTCDVAQEKTESIIVCAVWSLASVVLGDPSLRQKAEEAAKREKLGELPSIEEADVESRVERIVERSGPLRGHFNAIIKGERPAYAMLPAHEPLGRPKSLASFEHVYSLPRKNVASLVAGPTERLRLRPPYREHVSAAFGRYFSRIGLPVDVPRYP